MCDYSLEGFATREAKAGDRLVAAPLGDHGALGFVTPETPDVAVCLVPGAKVRLDQVPEDLQADLRISRGDIARFVQRDLASNVLGFRDALAFDHHMDGVTVLIQDLQADVTIEVITVSSDSAPVDNVQAPTDERVLEPA